MTVKSEVIKSISPQTQYVKKLFVFSLVYTISFIIGCVLFHFLDCKSSAIIDEKISLYFSVDFSSCETVSDYADYLLNINMADISHLAIIFAAGFTFLTVAIIFFLIAFRGFSLGFSIAYFTNAIRNENFNFKYPYLTLICYSFMCAAVAAVMIHVGVQTVGFADKFKAICGRPLKIIKSKALYFQILRFLIALGAIILLNFFRCIF